MFNCVIIDDEERCIDALRGYLQRTLHLNLIGTYTDPRTAIVECKDQQHIDLLFLDIEMPALSGLEVAQVLRPKVQKLIFTTSHGEHALAAFDVHADAFLLKPFSFAKFTTAVDRLTTADHRAPRLNGPVDDHFLVKSKDDDLRVVRVLYREIIAIESVQNYIKIHLDGKRPILAYLTLGDMLNLLATRREFRQVHRAYIISTNYITLIEGQTLRLANQLSLTVSETYKSNFSSYLSERLIRTNRKK